MDSYLFFHTIKKKKRHLNVYGSVVFCWNMKAFIFKRLKVIKDNHCSDVTKMLTQSLGHLF